MGAVYRPKDVLKGRRRRIMDGLRDLNPSLRDEVVEVLEAWEGKPSKNRLIELIGKEKARRIIEQLDI